jgi:hypothetical protein
MLTVMVNILAFCLGAVAFEASGNVFPAMAAFLATALPGTIAATFMEVYLRSRLSSGRRARPVALPQHAGLARWSQL